MKVPVQRLLDGDLGISLGWLATRLTEDEHVQIVLKVRSQTAAAKAGGEFIEGAQAANCEIMSAAT